MGRVQQAGHLVHRGVLPRLRSGLPDHLRRGPSVEPRGAPGDLAVASRWPGVSAPERRDTIGLAGCAGYAQARAFAEVEVETDTAKEIVTVWGQPFSLG
ncbi:MspA family porin [Nocardia farcinica]|nr:MspA family porin [Nocardia farcinica]